MVTQRHISKKAAHARFIDRKFTREPSSHKQILFKDPIHSMWKFIRDTGPQENSN